MKSGTASASASATAAHHYELHETIVDDAHVYQDGTDAARAGLGEPVYSSLTEDAMKYKPVARNERRAPRPVGGQNVVDKFRQGLPLSNDGDDESGSQHRPPAPRDAARKVLVPVPPPASPKLALFLLVLALIGLAVGAAGCAAAVDAQDAVQALSRRVAALEAAFQPSSSSAVRGAPFTAPGVAVVGNSTYVVGNDVFLISPTTTSVSGNTTGQWEPPALLNAAVGDIIEWTGPLAQVVDATNGQNVPQGRHTQILQPGERIFRGLPNGPLANASFRVVARAFGVNRASVDGVFTGDITIVAQSRDSLDAWVEAYRNVQEVRGSVAITSTGVTSAQLKAMFGNVRVVFGSINLNNNVNLTNLDAFVNLTRVGGNFFVQTSLNMVSLRGLSSLRAVGGSVSFSNLASLPSLSGLQSLATIGGSLTLNSIPLVTSLAELASLVSVGLNLQVSNAYNLTSLVGLHNVRSAGSLYFSGLQNVTSLAGLRSLAVVNNGVQIDSVVNLATFAGLDSLSSIGTFLIVTNCPQLKSLGALSSTLTFLGGYLQISNCPQLAAVELHPSFIGGSVTVSNNANVTVADFRGVGRVSGSLILDGLAMLTRVDLRDVANITAPLQVTNCPALLSLAVNALTTVDSIQIGSNPKLENISLASLKSTTFSHVRIFGNDMLVIVDLGALARVAGDLEFSNNAQLLRVLAGNLAVIQGSLNVQSCPKLVGLNLIALAAVGANVQFGSNDALDQINLRALATIGRSLYVFNHYAAVLVDLGNVVSVGGYFLIDRMPQLAVLNVTNLTTVGGYVELQGCSVLNNARFSALTTIGGFLQLNNNPALATLDLNKLVYLAGFLALISNTALTNLGCENSLVKWPGLGQLYANSFLAYFEYNPLLMNLSFAAVTCYGAGSWSCTATPACQAGGANPRSYFRVSNVSTPCP